MATHVYPSGPDPVANPLITSFVDPPFLAVYAYLGAVVAATLSWTFRRRFGVKGSARRPADSGDEPCKRTPPFGDKSRATEDVAIEVDGSNRFHMGFRGYKNHWLGTAAFCSIVSLGPLLALLYITVLFDVYWDCELSGLDALCFYGSYPLSGSSEVNSVTFMVLWVVTLAVLVVGLIAKDQLRNLCRMPCSSKEAEFVWIEVPVEEKVLMKTVSPLVRYVRALKVHFKKGRNTYQVTVPIKLAQDGTKYYELKARRYIMTAEGHFQPAIYAPVSTYRDIQEVACGLSRAESAALLNYVGSNAIPYMPDTIMASIAIEFLTPFYLYQLLVYMLWIWFGYMFAGLPQLAIVVLIGASRIYVNRNNQKTIAKLTEHSTSCEVLRQGEWETLSSEDLVPGDVVKIWDGWVLPCDLAVLQGSCVVNESALTGEATPVQKQSAPKEDAMLSEVYNPSGSGKRYTLFAGTTVLQSCDPGARCDDGKPQETLAVVTSTAINTSKGDILSAILFPSQMVFRYDEELVVVSLILGFYAFMLFLAVNYIFAVNGQPTTYPTTFAYSVFTISQVFSPLLPVALIAGQVLASVRLKNKGIFCINPARIAIAGKIRVFCFDKTGTITKDSLDFLGARHVDRAGKIIMMSGLWHPRDSVPDIDLLRAMASCHAVSLLGDTLVGNEVEVKMFEATGWNLVSRPNDTPLLTSPDGSDRLRVVRRFEFDHERQAMTVVVRDASGAAFVFVKGSFEKIEDISKPNTVPDDYKATAKNMALEGCYVLAVAMKALGRPAAADIDNLDRDEFERDMELLGMVAFRNELKSDSSQAIAELRNGDIRCVMVTGDNAQCGHYVAEKCGMISPQAQMLLGELDESNQVVWSGMAVEDQENKTRMSTAQLYGKNTLNKLQEGSVELAVTGKAYGSLVQSGDMDRLLFFTRIFARMSPTDKVAVVRSFVDKDLVVGMCGDGGNDCGALREAHAGVALSDAEASVVAPFTSKQKSCASVVTLLNEGKCALHTSFSSYKFLIMYGQLYALWKITEYSYGVEIAYPCYILVDVVVVVLMTYAITCALPCERLKPDRPTASLFSPSTMFSTLGLFAIYGTVFFVSLALMSNDPQYLQWPARLAPTSAWWLNGDNWESTYVFWPIYFSFVASALIFGFGGQYKRPIWTNWQLVLSGAGLFAFGSYMILSDENSFTRIFHVASEQFNYAEVVVDIPQSVWATYQQLWLVANPGLIPCFPDPGLSEPCNPGLNISQRSILFTVIVLGIGMSALWQALVVDSYGKLLKVYFRDPSRATFPL